MKAGFAFTGESPVGAPPRLKGATPLRPQLEANAAGIGHISLNPGDPSAVVRAVPLFLSDGEQLYPNLALEALRVAQGASTYVLAGAPDVPDTMTLVKIGEFVVPVTAAGELWLYVSPDRAERYVSARQVLGAGRPLARNEGGHRRQHRLRRHIGGGPAGHPHDRAWAERPRRFAARPDRRADPVRPFSLAARLGRRRSRSCPLRWRAACS